MPTARGYVRVSTEEHDGSQCHGPEEEAVSYTHLTLPTIA